MPDTQTHFAVGDYLDWDPDLLDDTVHPSPRYGQGPFEVVEVIDVPTVCSSPGSYCHNGVHAKHCNITAFQTVGHSQWVVIRLPDGSVPRHAQHNGNATFSGVWFTRL